jgi:hypothetical protein
MSRPKGSGVVPLRIRFARFVSPEPNTGCWLWAGNVNRKGYGSVSIRRSTNDRAHRVSWRLHKGEIPPSLWVLHKCGVPSCVNPDHLFLGTCADNLQDMARKGRQVFQRHPEKAPRGTRNGNAKLTESKVAAIRSSGGTCIVRAARYGVSQSLISAIRTGIIWK